MQKSTAATRHPVLSLNPASTRKDATPDTTPQLIALAVSLVGDPSKVLDQMRCSEGDFFLYRSGRKEVPLPELDRLVSLIIEEQRANTTKHRESLKAIRAGRG